MSAIIFPRLRRIGSPRTATGADAPPVIDVGTRSQMVEITLDEGDRLDWALKKFKKKVEKAGVLKDLRRKRQYTKPSEERKQRAAAAKRRSFSRRPAR